VLTLRARATPAGTRTKTLLFEDPASSALRKRIERVAPSDAPVLITGETGTGKELVAREIHALSRRAGRPFVAFNAGAVSDALAESELFGHDKGAFTGAHASKPGWFHAADGGTLFLDEIGDLPLALQVKLLRVLQEGEVTPIGSRASTPVNVRVIAATNVDLQAAIRAGRFREDLFYRLNVASLTLRPLRERPLDILPLAHHFLERYAQELGRGIMRLGASAIQLLLSHTWPGNVRELENAIHNALLVCGSHELAAEDFELAPDPRPQGQAGCASQLAALERSFLALLECGVPDLHRQAEATLLAAAYRYAGGNQLETARLLGISRNIVRARLIEHGTIQGTLRGPRGARVVGIAPAPVRSLPAKRSAGTLRIGFQKLGLLMLAKEHGTLDTTLAAQGVEVEWIECADGIEIVDALAAGELSAGVVGDCPAVFAQAQEVPIVYLAAEPPAPRGTALVVRRDSPVSCVRELQGRRVAVSRAAQAHYLLLRAFEEACVDPTQIEICFLSPERARRAFQAGEVDAWSIWDPWLSAARLELGARVLRDASGLLQNSAYYLARRDFAEQHPAVVAELLTQLENVATWVKSDPLRAADLMAPRLGVSACALLASLTRDLDARPLTAQLIAGQQEIADRLLRLQLIERPISVAAAQWLPA
jgi:aliphatic sulfonates family ABC transporter substrate-binding protein